MLFHRGLDAPLAEGLHAYAAEQANMEQRTSAKHHLN